MDKYMITIIFQAKITVFGGLSEMRTYGRTYRLVSSLKNPRWNLSKQISEEQKPQGTSVTELRREWKRRFIIPCPSAIFMTIITWAISKISLKINILTNRNLCFLLQRFFLQTETYKPLVKNIKEYKKIKKFKKIHEEKESKEIKHKTQQQLTLQKAPERSIFSFWREHLSTELNVVEIETSMRSLFLTLTGKSIHVLIDS